MHYLALSLFALYGSFVLLFVILFVADVEDKQVRSNETEPEREKHLGNMTLLEDLPHSYGHFSGHTENR
ncbi:unnamed protein product [Bursaphelenchus xylophilus]|uniref:(pine wood nematode) hypothetical protein n=1 Tax=Bursaphelenchus xylophilus TaxID=6326 RepID=A0A1I7RUX7_BURXY|nr:unnamed protein product [Bursaphelenchus xylophilus]CAG9105331.1 unnamed protein product [Bursaphelenchus xylophilus]